MLDTTDKDNKVSINRGRVYVRPDCPVYQGTFLCVICLRSGRDLRSLFCKVRTGPRVGVR
jgi:hypothetical protein